MSALHVVIKGLLKGVTVLRGLPNPVYVYYINDRKTPNMGPLPL